MWGGGTLSLPRAQRYQLEFLTRCMLPGWVTGGLRGPSPIAGAPCTPPSPPALSQIPELAPSSLRNSRVHSAAPSKPTLPPRKLPGPVRPWDPQMLSPPAPRTSQVSAQPWALACTPTPAPPVLKRGGQRADRTQARPSRCGRTVRRVTQAGPAPPPRGRGHWRRRGRPRDPAAMPGEPEHSWRPLPCWWAPSGGA